MSRRSSIYLDDVLLNVKRDLDDTSSFSGRLSSICERYLLILDSVNVPDLSDQELEILSSVFLKPNFVIDDILHLDLELEKLLDGGFDDIVIHGLILKIQSFSIAKRVKLLENYL